MFKKIKEKLFKTNLSKLEKKTIKIEFENGDKMLVWLH